MTKNIIKYAAGGVGVVIAALGVIWGIGYWRMTHDPEYVRSREGERIMDEWKKMYADDTYGGDTPEETLRLFIDALKRGDTDLASKYFVVDEWDRFHTELERLKRRDSLEKMLDDLSKIKLVKKNSTEAFFTLVGANGVAETGLTMDLNPLTKVWKITEM